MGTIDEVNFSLTILERFLKTRVKCLCYSLKKQVKFYESSVPPLYFNFIKNSPK